MTEAKPKKKVGTGPANQRREAERLAKLDAIDRMIAEGTLVVRQATRRELEERRVIFRKNRRKPKKMNEV